jgi:short-subunit dehydrogenase
VLERQAARLSAKYGVNCIALSADLADPEAAQWIAAELKRRRIDVDLLVNNAGLGLSGNFLSHEMKQVHGELQVNVQALLSLSHLFGKGMQQRGKGGIINLASNASFQPLPAMATYAATKAFVLHFSEALNYEMAADGVHVMAVCPGPTATGFFDGTTTKLSSKDFDTSESVVQKSLAAFDQGKSVAYPTRLSVRIGTLLPRFLPRALVTRIAGSATKNMGLH